MGDLVDHIVDEFSASELVIVAESVGLAPTSRWGSRRLVDVIIAKIDKDGIPNPPKAEEELWERSESLLEDFLYVSGYTDETGKRLKGGKTEELDLDDFLDANNIDKEPDCFSYADDADPACKRCIVYRFCAEERIASLPECFGILYDRHNPECKVCLEAPFCKTAIENV